MVNKIREKDSDRDSMDKRHRKTSSSNANDAPPIKILKEDIYANIVKFEEDESKKRLPEKDSSLFMDTCDKLRKICAEIAKLKSLNNDKGENEIREKRIKGTFLFAMLKKLNRLDKVRLRAGRDALHKEKLSVDSNKLQLQNLLYEADHLRKEVQHCLQFKSQDEEIDLVTEEEFYREAPESIARRDKTENDEHARRLARLEWELKQRDALANKCCELRDAKKMVSEEIESKTNRLDSLIPCLDALLKATRPLQEALEINIEAEWAVQKVANLLPRPLYLLYVNLSAYGEISDKLITTVINGEEEEAKELVDQAETIDLASQDSDADDNDQESERPTKKHHHRRQASIAAIEVNVFKPHPLSVTFKLASALEGASLLVTLYFLPALRLVTVEIKLTDFDVQGFAAKDVLDSNNLLNCLSSDEKDNDDLLHPKTVYALKKISLDSLKFLSMLNEKHLGKPYKWAQNLCGLNFMACDQSSIDHELIQLTVPNIIENIRNRLQSRIKLYKQILCLEQKNLNCLIPSDDPLSTARVSGTLVQWIPIQWSEYIESGQLVKKFIDEDIVTKSHLLYSAIVIRGSAKLECLVSISPNFPNESPLWAISLSWNGNRNPLNSSDIREIEYWVNFIQTNKINADNIIGTQLKRVMTALDIYLETEGSHSTERSSEFVPEKTFIKAFRRRTHSRPYKVVQNGGSIIYTQI